MKFERRSQIGMLAVIAGLAVSLSPTFGKQQNSTSSSQSSTSSGQTSSTVSAAEAARKAREQKKQQPKPAHVWDDDNLPKGGGVNVVGQPETAATPANTSTPDASAPQAAAPMSPKEQSQLQSAIQEAQDKISDLKKDIDIAQRKFSLDSDMYYGKPDYSSDREGKKALDNEQAAIRDKQDQLQQAQRELADLQAKAGAAGGAPKS